MIVRVTIELDTDNNGAQAEALLRSLVGAFRGGDAALEADELPAGDAEAKNGRKRTTRRKRARRGEGVIALVKNLQTDGYFEEQRSARDVRDELVQRGHSIDNRQIYATLKYLADKNMLQRELDNGTFLYRAG